MNSVGDVTLSADLAVNSGAIANATDISAATATINDTIGTGSVNSIAISGATPECKCNDWHDAELRCSGAERERDSYGSAITFTDTLNADAVADGNETLTVATGSAQFEGAVGGTNALGNIGVATTHRYEYRLHSQCW